MPDRPLLVTTTGEPFQPSRLHYTVRDRRGLEACMRELECVDFDKGRNRWVWLFDAEASSLEFKRSWKDVSKHGPVVLGSFYMRGTSAAELYVRSIERALMAVTFFDEYVPRTVARITDMDVANRLFSADECDLTPEAVFAAAAETDLRQQVEEREALLANPEQMMADFHQQISGGERKKLPELERLPTNFYEDGIELLTQTLSLRQHLAMQSWLGNRDVTMMDVILEGPTGRTASGAYDSRESREPTRINWNFGPEVPVHDFFESFDLSNSFDPTEAVENFIHDMETDEFRTGESVIREEQGLATMLILIDLAAELMNFDDPDADDPVHYIDGIERCNEPWYEILRRIAPHLTIERLRTADVHDDILVNGWPRIATCIERRARGLSLPEGVRRPLDVVPEELRHRLWLQSCCNPLCGLGQEPELTLVEEEEHWRIDEFLGLLHQHRDSVEFLGLTLDGLLQRCELPDRDRPIFVRTVSDRLGLGGTGELLAPKLEAAAGWSDELGEPIQRLPKEDIRQAILHPEPAAFRTAIRYFAGADSRDTGLAPVVIEAMQAMEDDRDRAFACICLQQFAQTDETSERILQQLKALRSSGDETNLYRHAFAASLLAAKPSFLASNKRDILAAMSNLDRLQQDNTEAQISDLRLDVDDRWDTFVHLVHGDELSFDIEDFYPSCGFVERVQSLIHGMGDDERPVRWVMETLPQTINEEDYSSAREMIAVSLSGVLRLREATPYLIALLHDDDREMVEYAFRSLSRIGGDAVIEALDRCFADAGQYFQLQAATVLQYIESDRSVRTLEKWSRDAEDESVQCRVRQALLEQFVTSEIDRARRWMIDANPRCDEADGLRRALVANSLIVGRDFAELDDWLAAVREDLASEPSPEDLWDDGDPSNDEEEEDEDEEDRNDDSNMSGGPFSLSRPGRVADDPQPDRDPRPMFETPAATIINSGQKVGRNDPCPCGSGKKYKKCCRKKQ